MSSPPFQPHRSTQKTNKNKQTKTEGLTPPCSWPNPFRCGDGSCIDASTQRCNGVADCADSSDESDCAFRKTTFLLAFIQTGRSVFTFGFLFKLWFTLHTCVVVMLALLWLTLFCPSLVVSTEMKFHEIIGRRRRRRSIDSAQRREKMRVDASADSIVHHLIAFCLWYSSLRLVVFLRRHWSSSIYAHMIFIFFFDVDEQSKNAPATNSAARTALASTSGENAMDTVTAVTDPTRSTAVSASLFFFFLCVALFRLMAGRIALVYVALFSRFPRSIHSLWEIKGK